VDTDLDIAEVAQGDESAPRAYWSVKRRRSPRRRTADPDGTVRRAARGTHRRALDESNARMIAINETLGFRPRLRFGQWQLQVPP